jgi:HK97 family phage portal protein
MSIRTALVSAAKQKSPRGMTSVDNSRGWTTLFSSGPDGFQTDTVVNPDKVDTNWVIWACKTLIAGDIGKLRIKLVEWDGRIWNEVTDSTAFNPVLRKPNAFQTRQQFIEQWQFSLLGNGNTYALKERDNRGVVVRLYILDPTRVKPLVAPDGSVYYELQEDLLATVPMGLPAVPASEIIHDRANCLFHPLVGLPPLFANGLAATQGLKIQSNSEQFFRNMSRPSGILTTPGTIGDTLAKTYKDRWEQNYGGANVGRVAVLGNDLKYQPLAVNADDAQLVEQLKMSAEMICSTFHVPGYKVGVGPMPPYQSAQILNQIYYTDCLQRPMEAIEALLDEGLGLVNVTGRTLGTEFDLDGLLRMDTLAQMEVASKGVASAIYSPNEGRAKFNLPTAPGGDKPYLQQQNYSLEALAARDASADPFGKAASAPAAGPAADPTAAKELVAGFQALAQAIEKATAEPRVPAVGEQALAEVKRYVEELSAELKATKAGDDEESVADLAGALISKFTLAAEQT